MKPRLVVVGLLLLSIVGSVAGWIILHSGMDASVAGYTLIRYAKAALYGMGALALVFLALLLVPKAFSAWWKFAIWFVPLAFLVFITAPEPQGWVSPIPAPQVVFQWVSGIYLGISAVIIAMAAAKK